MRCWELQLNNTQTGVNSAFIVAYFQWCINLLLSGVFPEVRGHIVSNLTTCSFIEG